MKVKSLVILIIAIIFGGLLYYFGAKQESGLVGSNTYLIPDLSSKLNDVTKLTIYGAGDTLLTLISKAESNWIVDNRDGYEADIVAVRSLFKSLSEAKLIEAKTSNPENYVRLGVEDMDNPNAQGVQFSIDGLGDEIKIIAGNDGNIGKNSQYIRRVDEEQSWLIDKKLDINKDATHWLKKDLLDIPPERIKTIQIKHPDGSVISIENQGTEDYEFALLNTLPDGKKISESEIYQVANALSSLQLIDVASLENLDEEAIQPIFTEFSMYDGIVLIANSFTIEDVSYSTFEINFNAENVEESSSKIAEDVDPALISNAATAEKFVQETAPKLKGWAFVLPTITKDALIKKLDNFILDEDAS